MQHELSFCFRDAQPVVVIGQLVGLWIEQSRLEHWLAGVTVLCFCARHSTLTVPVNHQGNVNKMLGATCDGFHPAF